MFSLGAFKVTSRLKCTLLFDLLCFVKPEVLNTLNHRCLSRGSFFYSRPTRCDHCSWYFWLCACCNCFLFKASTLNLSYVCCSLAKLCFDFTWCFQLSKILMLHIILEYKWSFWFILFMVKGHVIYFHRFINVLITCRNKKNLQLRSVLHRRKCKEAFTKWTSKYTFSAFL